MIETPEKILAEVFSLPPASVGSIDLNVCTDSMVLINDEGPINTSTVTNRRLSFVAVSANRDDFDQLSQLATCKGLQAPLRWTPSPWTWRPTGSIDLTGGRKLN